MVSLRSLRRCRTLQGLFDGSAVLGGFATFECERRGNKGRHGSPAGVTKPLGESAQLKKSERVERTNQPAALTASGCLKLKNGF
jgi:hypothetical protein